MQRIPRAHYKQMPWKNGLGLTAEIDRVPGGEGAYQWRLSQAVIRADGPFSSFPGYDRWLAVWRGEPIFLNERKVGVLEPVRFSGDEPTFCRLGEGEVHDVGLIFDRRQVDAQMSVVTGTVQLPSGGVYYIFDIASGDTLKLDQATTLSVGRSLLITLHRRV